MLVVGLTGGIGCGKTLVSDLFHRLFDIPIIDADLITKDLTQNKNVIEKIATQLGSEFVDENHQLKKTKLREAVFSSPDLRSKLENILHPLVYEEISRKLNKLNSNYCIVVIPLLIETNRIKLFDRILVVDCAIEDQISRVMQRDQCSAAHVQKIINSQVDRNTRLSMADDIIDNKSTIDMLQKKVITLHNQYLELSDHISKT